MLIYIIAYFGEKIKGKKVKNAVETDSAAYTEDGAVTKTPAETETVIILGAI